MNHETIRDLIPAYALGATEADESAQIETHLRRCSQCRALLADYQILSDDLLYTIPPVAAPSHLAEDLRRRLVPAEPVPKPVRRRWRFDQVRVPAFAMLAASLILLVVTNVYWISRTTRVERTVAVQATAIPLLLAGQRTELVGDAPAPEAWGELRFAPDGHLGVLQVRELPALPPGKVYQLWLIRDGERDSGGLFQVNEHGEGFLLVKSPRPFREYDAVGVTVEPAGGSPGPTSPRVIGGEL